MIDVHVKLRRPHPKQQLIKDDPRKRKIVRAGRRGGKTTLAAIIACEYFLKGRRVLYGAPTTEQIDAFWFDVKLSLQALVDLGVYRKNETEHIIEKPLTKQRIRAKTCWNADTLRGDYGDLLILDEFHLMNEDTWEIVGAPMMLDTNGDALFIYTPPSLHTRSISKAKDPRHAAKMWKEKSKDPSWACFHFTSRDNPHLSREAFERLTSDMTRLAIRQEIDAEDIDEVPGALWTRRLIEDTRLASVPVQLSRVVVGVDPSGSTVTEAGIIGGGIGTDKHLYFLADRTPKAAKPEVWAKAAVDLYYDLSADRVIGERNYGGDMVESTIRAIDKNVSYKDVIATRGKMVRAEPVCALFERGVAHFVGFFPELEEELVTYIPGDKSPNRMDAMVWVGTELGLGAALGIFDYYQQQAEQAHKDQDKPMDIHTITELHRQEDQERSREEFSRRIRGGF